MTRARLFRDGAIEYASARVTEGEIVRISPRWTRWAYWLVVAAFGSMLLFAIVGTSHDYASGSAVVWISGHTEVTAFASSTVEKVLVRPGDRVEAGAELVRFYAAREHAEFDRVKAEFDAELVKMLRDPQDDAARHTLAALGAQKGLLASNLDQTTLRAPVAGIVGDVRIRAGQLLAQGDAAVTLLDQHAECGVVAMIPAMYRPQLTAGAPFRFEVTGYRYAYQNLVVGSIDAQIVGASEIKKFLGQELADTLHVEGPVEMVRAPLPSCRFEVDGESYDFHHGMNGVAEIRLRSQSILVSVVPGLRVLWERFHG